MLESIKGARLIPACEEVETEELSIDSAKKTKNGLYFCLTGGKLDGHQCAEKAVNNGAVAIVSERELNISVPQIIVKDSRNALSYISSAFYGHPSERLKVIAVTGNPNSWLAQFSDAHLTAAITNEGGPLNRAPRASILVETLVLQALSVVLQERRAITPQEYVMRHPGGALGQLRENEK